MARELEAERDFLLARLTRNSADWVGRSSNEMVRAAITGGRPYGLNIPYDQGDLGRCEETYLRAPAHLKPRMLPILRAFRCVVTERKSWPNPISGTEATQLLAAIIKRESARD